MKKAFRFFLSSLLVVLLCSCAQVIDNRESDLSFSVDDVIKEVCRAGENQKNVVLDFNISLTGAVNRNENRELTFGDIGTAKTVFSFDKIPVDQPLKITIIVRSKDVFQTVVYSGGVSLQGIKKGSNNVHLDLNGLNRFLLWNCGPNHTGPYNFRIYDHTMTNSIAGDKSNTLIDYFFDENNNLYTLEENAADRKYLVVKYPYVAPDLFEIIYETSTGFNNLICLAGDGKDFYLGYEDPSIGGMEGNRVDKITGKTTTENIISLLPLAPKHMACDNKGNLYVVVSGQDGPVYKYAKEGNVFVEKNSGYDILGTNEKNLTISDVQIQGNYLYALTSRGVAADVSPGPGDGFSGGVIPVEINGDTFTSKPIFGLDENGIFANRETEYISKECFYHPTHFVSYEKGKLFVADDGQYSLSKPGYSEVCRNVNRVVTLSLSNPQKPVIESFVNTKPKGITFKTDEPEEPLEFLNRYMIWTGANYAFLNTVKDIDLDTVITKTNDPSNAEPLPREVSGYMPDSLIDFHIDKNYGVYSLVSSNSDSSKYINIHNYKKIENNGSIIYEESEFPNCIASDGTYVYVGAGTNITRYKIDTRVKDISFDIASEYKTITALEFDNNGVLYIAASMADDSELRILQYKDGLYSPPTVVSLSMPVINSSVVDTGKLDLVKGKCKIADMQVIGDKLYVLRRFAYAAPHVCVSSGVLNILNVNNVQNIGADIGLKPNFREEPASPNLPTAETTFFFGPQKFIALKPDEIVIADDGITANTSEANSIVTLDLKGNFKNRVVLSKVDFGNTYSASEFY